LFKIPDGAFSKGVIKAENRSLNRKLNTLFKKFVFCIGAKNTSLYTESTARIGVFKPTTYLACRYYMVEKTTGRIYQHSEAQAKSGGLTHTYV